MCVYNLTKRRGKSAIHIACLSSLFFSIHFRLQCMDFCQIHAASQSSCHSVTTDKSKFVAFRSQLFMSWSTACQWKPAEKEAKFSQVSKLWRKFAGHCRMRFLSRVGMHLAGLCYLHFKFIHYTCPPHTL